MSSRSDLSKRHLAALRLAESIDRFGIETMPCSYCSARGLRCKVLAERSDRYSECVRRSHSCDVLQVAVSAREWLVPPGAWFLLTGVVSRINREADRLESAEESAEEELLRLHQKVQEAQNEINTTLAHLSHLRR